MSGDPACLGGLPAFADLIPISHLVLPDVAELMPGLSQIQRSGIITRGPFLSKLEKEVAERCHVKHAIGVSSCTSALTLVSKCLGLSGEVIVPSFTFMATITSLLWNKLRPVFVDVDPETTNIAPEAVEAAITEHTSAIMAVHNFGAPAAIDALESIAKKHNLRLIFDAAPGFGSLFQGKPLGANGDAECFSMSATKLVVAGEGGIVTTNNDQLATALMQAREYGHKGDYNCQVPGMNARLSEYHALAGLLSLYRLEDAARCRNEIATIYKQELAGLPGIRFQTISAGNRSSYKDFSIMVDAEVFGMSRNELAIALLAENIETRSYHSPPTHKQDAFRWFAAPDLELPVTAMLGEQSLSLPIWSVMDPGIVEKISKAIWQIHSRAKAVKMCLDAKQAALSCV